MAAERAMSRSTLYGYSFFRAPLSALDLTLRSKARTSIWQDTLKMTASKQAMLVSAIKSTDFLLGFLVGKASDNLRSRFGRRRPFIALAFPVGLLCFFLFCSAGYIFGKTPPTDMPCTHLVNASGNSSSCPELKECLDAAIANGSLWAPNNTAVGPGHLSYSARPGLDFTFVLLYFGFIFCTWTCTQIPYDALGLELTDDYDERTFLFGVKVAFQFLGYILFPAAGLVLAGMTSDVVAITTMQAAIFAILGFVAQAGVLTTVKERNQGATAPLAAQSADADSKLKVPAIPSARRALANKPYLKYLALKIPLTIFSLVPSNMLSFYVKFVLAIENYTSFEMIVLLVALIGALVSIPFSVQLAKKWGKGTTLGLILTTNSCAYLLFAVIPYTVYRSQQTILSMIIGFVMGLGQSLAFGLPDALLADIIDYDELITGERNEGIFSVIETNLQQFVDIAGGVIPLMVLGAVGYKPLGGCSCGCGISCETQEGLPYARWMCPNNIGYTCTGALGSTLLYAPEPSFAPCAEQSPAVLWAITMFLTGLPGLCGLVAGFFAFRQLITPSIHASIRAQLDAPAATIRTDPFTQTPMNLPANSADSIVREHYAHSELVAAGGSGLAHLKLRIGGQLLLWLAVIGGLLGAMAASGTETVVTIGCLFLMALFVLVPWDGARFYLLLSKGDKLLALHEGPTLVGGEKATQAL